MDSLFTRKFVGDLVGLDATARSPTAGARIAAGRRVYAVGDIHGRADLLRRMVEMITADVAGRPTDHATVVYLGDYVDRGPDSRAVIETLLSDPVPNCAAVHLLGNHDAAFLDFLTHPERHRIWLDLGGRETFRSYGAAPPDQTEGRFGVVQAALRLRPLVPQRHVDFLGGLRPFYVEGGYIFAHAGVRPGIALADQSLEDLTTIRNEFLRARQPIEAVVVHGHTPARNPVVRPARIGVDTAAWRTGRLTCVVLEDAAYSFLQT